MGKNINEGIARSDQAECRPRPVERHDHLIPEEGMKMRTSDSRSITSGLTRDVFENVSCGSAG